MLLEKQKTDNKTAALSLPFYLLVLT